MKSHRRRDGWRQAKDRARRGGGPFMKTCPAWLEVGPERFRVKEEAAAVVRQIFALAREGLGVYRITERLTREKVPPNGSGARWVKAYVSHILVSPAAMGTYQPQRREGKRSVPDGAPVPNHYPAVVTEEEWNEAQTAIRRRSFGGRGAGRRGIEEANLFAGMIRCATTGEKMHIVHSLGRETEGGRKRYVYLCPTRETGAPGRRIDYHVFEAAVLSAMRELTPADLAADGEHANGWEAEIARLSGRLLDIDNRLERAKQRARTAEDCDAFFDLIQELQAERQQVSERLAELRNEDAGRPAADLGEAHSIIDILKQSPPGQREDLRRRLKARIRQLLTGFWLVIVPRGRNRLCAVQMDFRGCDRRRDYVIWHQPREREWACRTLASVAKPGDLDLRKPADAQKLERLLRQIPNGLT